MIAAIATILSAVLIPLLTWLFSGSSTTEIKHVAGLHDLDNLHGNDDLNLPEV